MLHRYLIMFFFILFSINQSCDALAGQKLFSSAFKTVGIWNKAKSVRIDVSIWYPTYSNTSTVSYGPWRLNVARHGRSVEGRFPVIILSHDTAATRFSYHETAGMLASFGFVVIAPEHGYDNIDNMSLLFKWEQLERRMQDIRNILDFVLKHNDVRFMVDSKRIGILGFGTGATVALLFGGARLDANGWNDYCIMVPQSVAYCNAWALKHVEKMTKQLPSMKKDFADDRISIIAAVSPKYDMFFTQQSLSPMQKPLLLLETEEELGKRAWHAQKIQAFFPEKTVYSVIEKVNELDLMALCPKKWRDELPDICGTASSEVRSMAQKIFHERLLGFFLSHLGTVVE